MSDDTQLDECLLRVIRDFLQGPLMCKLIEAKNEPSAGVSRDTLRAIGKSEFVTCAVAEAHKSTDAISAILALAITIDDNPSQEECKRVVAALRVIFERMTGVIDANDDMVQTIVDLFDMGDLDEDNPPALSNLRRMLLKYPLLCRSMGDGEQEGGDKHCVKRGAEDTHEDEPVAKK